MRGWHSEDIKAELRKRGTSLFALARAHRMLPHAMSQSLRKRYPRYHRVIAEFLDVPVHELWPHWYLPCGRPTGKSRPDVVERRHLQQMAAE